MKVIIYRTIGWLALAIAAITLLFQLVTYGIDINGIINSVLLVGIWLLCIWRAEVNSAKAKAGRTPL